LSDRLKGSATRREQEREASGAVSQPLEAKLHPSNAEGKARVKRSAERLKEQARARMSEPVEAKVSGHSAPAVPSPLEQMSDEDRLAHAERAQEKLRQSLKRLSRKRS